MTLIEENSQMWMSKWHIAVKFCPLVKNAIQNNFHRSLKIQSSRGDKIGLLTKMVRTSVCSLIFCQYTLHLLTQFITTRLRTASCHQPHFFSIKIIFSLLTWFIVLPSITFGIFAKIRYCMLTKKKKWVYANTTL